MFTNQSKEWDEIYGLIKKVRKQLAGKHFAIMASVSIVISAAVYLIFIALYHIFNFSPATSFEMLLVLIVAFLIGVSVSLKSIVFPNSDKKIVLIIEKNFPQLKDQLACSYELANQPSNEIMTNWHLFDAIWCSTQGCVKKINFNELIKPQLIRTRYIAIAAALITIFFTTLFLPNFFISATTGFMLSAKAYKIMPGDITVASGTDITVKLLSYVPVSGQAVLKYRIGEQEWQESGMDKISNNLFESQLSGLQNNVRYCCSIEGFDTKYYNIKVINPPAIETFSAVCKYPSYAGLEDKEIGYVGDIAELKGTNVKMEFTANKKIKKAIFRMGGKKSSIEQKDKNFTKEFEISRNTSYEIKFYDFEGLESELYKYDIKAVEDQAPTVAVNEPKDRESKKNDEIIIEAEAEDDYRVVKTGIAYSINGGVEERKMVNFKKDQDKKVKFSYTMAISDLKLDNGDSIAYYAFAFDNHPEPKEGRSDIYFIDIADHKYKEGEGGGGLDMDMIQELIDMEKEVIRETWDSVKLQKMEGEQGVEEKVKNTGKKQSKIMELTEKEYDIIKLKAFDEAVSLDNAAQEMKQAEPQLEKIKPKPALPYEQKALAFLIQALKDAVKIRSKNASGKPQKMDEEQMKAELKKLEKERQDFMEKQKKDEMKELQEMAKKLEEILKEQQDLNNQVADKAKSGKSQELQKQQDKTEKKPEGEQSTNELSEKQSNIKKETSQVKTSVAAAQENINKAEKSMGGATKEYSKEKLNEGFKFGKKAETELKEALNALLEKMDKKAALTKQLKDMLDKMQDFKKELNEAKEKPKPEFDNKFKERVTDLKDLEKKLEKENLGKNGELGSGYFGNKFEFSKMDVYVKGANNSVEIIRVKLQDFTSSDVYKNIDRNRVPPYYKKLVDMYYEDLAKTKK